MADKGADIWYWPYELIPRRALSAIAAPGPRRGALIRVDDGFADVHPWAELGDAPLDEQLAMLARGETTPLTAASLRFAAIDAAARREGRSVFDGLSIPPSHWPGPDPPPGFDTVKLKSIDRIPGHVRLRIDFNATLTPEEFVRIAATLPHERIDFIEDPCPYDAATWRDLRDRTSLRLALDRGNGSEDVDVLVIKPAVQEIPPSRAEIVVTSYMDHPLGQLSAAYAAAKAGITTTCGLITHVLYESDQFIDRMQIDRARLIPPAGTGFGFDDLLENLPWRRI
ncbi:MAG TPA: enolase C-terminal domain-like protein [Thermoanaerobaculia bacterium]|nr:enolase C-terminal domain-like protein [Thermoanaerobaculia bacterium]